MQVVYTDLSLRLESNVDPEPELEPDAGLEPDSEDKQNTDCVDGVSLNIVGSIVYKVLYL